MSCASTVTETETGPTPTEPTIQIHATEFKLTPSHVHARPGQVVHIELINDGKQPHTLQVDLPDGPQKLVREVDPGKKGEMTVTTPATPGRFEFYCPDGDDRQKGMTGPPLVAPSGMIRPLPRP